MSDFKNIKWSPSEYAEVSVVAREAGLEALSRLDWMTIEPGIILDAGAGTGETSALLQKRYPNAKVLSCDLNEDMSLYAKETSALQDCITADVFQLPLPSESVDLIFANLLLPWVDNVEKLLKEWRRVLRPEGLLMLTFLGPDTLKEWRHVISAEDLPLFIDMHEIGDLLLHTGFSDPVLDVNYFTTTFRDGEKLFFELQKSGMTTSQNKTLYTETEQEEGVWSVTYEVAYAHAFMPIIQKQEKTADGATKISLSQLRQQLNSHR